MKRISNLVLILAVIFFSGCCPLFSSDKNKPATGTKTNQGKNLTPLDMLEKHKELVKAQQKWVEAQENPDISEEELMEIEEEFHKKQDEMIKTANDFQNSNFYKNAPPSMDKYVDKAREAQMKTSEAMIKQRKMMQQLEYGDNSQVKDNSSFDYEIQDVENNIDFEEEYTFNNSEFEGSSDDYEAINPDF